MLSFRLPQLFIITALITTALILFLVLETHTPNYFQFDDGLNQFLPYYTYNWHSLIEHKTIPHINFHQYLGQAYLGQGQSGVLFPPAYIATFLSKTFFGHPYSTMDIVSIAHFTIGALSMFIFLRKLSISKPVSFFSSLAWITFPYILVVGQAWPSTSYLAAYYPLSFLLLEMIIHKPNYKNIIGLSIIKSLFILQGYIQNAVIMMEFETLFMIIALLFLTTDKNRYQKRKIAYAYLTSLLITIVITAPLVLTMLDTKQQSHFRSVPLSEAEALSLQVTAQDFFSAQVLKFKPHVFFAESTLVLYVGPFVLALLALLPIIHIKNKWLKKRTTIYCLFAFLALLLSTSFYKIMLSIPIMNSFKGPHKHFPPFLFFLTLLIAIISSSITSNKKTFIGKQSIHLLLILIITLNMLVVLYRIAPHEIGLPPRTPIINYINKDSGRILSYKKNAPLAFDFASLYQINHFGGYDPLVSKQNLALSLNLQQRNEYEPTLDQLTLNYLSLWSVKYITAINTPEYQDQLNQFDQLNKTYENDSHILYENNQSLPYVYNPQHPKNKIPFIFGINHITINPINPKPHNLVITIAPLPYYSYFIDGKPVGRLQKNNNDQPQISVPANTKEIAIKYINYPFLVGLITIIALLPIILFITIITFKNTTPTNSHHFVS